MQSLRSNSEISICFLSVTIAVGSSNCSASHKAHGAIDAHGELKIDLLSEGLGRAIDRGPVAGSWSLRRVPGRSRIDFIDPMV